MRTMMISGWMIKKIFSFSELSDIIELQLKMINE